MTLGQLNSLLARVAEAQSPEYRDRAWNAIVDEFVKRSEWIDPQRLVELAKRYTDEEGHGWACLQFSDVAEGWNNWSVNTPEENVGALTHGEALKIAEEA